MSTEIKVPVFPESVTDGTLTSWHKNPGDFVHYGDVIVDIETDKVVFEVPSLVDGVLDEQLFDAGATVLSGQVIAKMTEQAQVAKATTKQQKQSTNETETLNITAEESTNSENFITPSALKMINENHLQGNKITGTGKGGRVLKEDVLSYLEKNSSVDNDNSVKSTASTQTESNQNSELNNSHTAKAEIPHSSVSHLKRESYLEKRVPMSRLRKRIAERLLQAQHSAAILTTINEVNMQAVMNLRQQYRDEFEKVHGVRLGFMSFFVKAVVAALKRFPEINASIDGDDIVYHGFYDIGIAVGSPRGLVVPIVRNVDQLSVAEIEQQINDFGLRAKEGSLSLDEITGGTFSITNGGVFGSLLSTPILNPPQSGILGMHKIEKRAVVIDDEIVIRPMMYLAFSYDHRIVDGKEAVQFLVAIKEIIEDPARLILQI